MTQRYFDCHACACLIRSEELTCPLCGATQRHNGAPLWLTAALVGGLGLADIACDARDDAPLFHREFATTGSTTVDTTEGSTGTGTTLDTTTTTFGDGDGSTYGGPDEDTWARDDDTLVITSSTTLDTNSDGSTYGGPDENTTPVDTVGEPTESDAGTASEPTESDASTAGASTESASTEPADTSTGSGGERSPDDAGCACDSRERPGHAALGLLLLGLLGRRRRAQSRR
jgi:MYXO-CTERM domain-containing protein